MTAHSAECDSVGVLSPCRQCGSSVLGTDWCWDYKSNHNRSDCQSVRGIAAETSSVVQTKSRVYRRHPASSSPKDWHSAVETSLPTKMLGRASQLDAAFPSQFWAVLKYFWFSAVLPIPVQIAVRPLLDCWLGVLLVEARLSNWGTGSLVRLESNRAPQNRRRDLCLLTLTANRRDLNFQCSNRNGCQNFSIPTSPTEVSLTTQVRHLVVTTKLLSRICFVTSNLVLVGKAMRVAGLVTLPTRFGEVYVSLPSRREDITTAADISEELGRSLTFYHLPSQPNQSGSHQSISPLPFGFSWLNKLVSARKLLVSRGYSEMVGSSFSSRSQPSEPRSATPVSITNPMTRKERSLRTSILDGWASSGQSQVRSGVRNLRFFEVGNSFGSGCPIISDCHHLVRPSLAVLSWEAVTSLFWGAHRIPANVRKLQYDLASLFQLWDTKFQTRTVRHPLLNPDCADGIVVMGRQVGHIGELQQQEAEPSSKKEGRPAVFEISLGSLVNCSEGRVTSLTKCSVAARDLSFVCQSPVGIQDLVGAVHAVSRKEATSPLLGDVRLFDTFRKGRQSVLGLRIPFSGGPNNCDSSRVLQSFINHSVRTGKVLASRSVGSGANES